MTMNISEIFDTLIKPNIGHTVTIKEKEWNGKEFITNDITGILEECETYTDYGNDGSMSFYLKVNGDNYEVTDKDFYFEDK